MINGLDLFSGIGGFALGLRQYIRTRAYCENDRYCQAVLLSRMHDGRIDTAPIWDNVSTFVGSMLPNIDIITGGFPCQDISVAGNGIGLDGERSGLFFEIVRIASELRPRFVFLENVPAITTRGGVRVISEFARLGYDCRWTIVSAAELGTPHLRRRWFLLAHANGNGIRDEPNGFAQRNSETEFTNDGEVMANSCREGLEGWVDAQTAWEAFRLGSGSGSGSEAWPQWLPQPSLCRGHDGLQNRVDRLRGLGNAVVPQQAKTAFERLMGLEHTG